jgi:hypothetical protein
VSVFRNLGSRALRLANFSAASDGTRLRGAQGLWLL